MMGHVRLAMNRYPVELALDNDSIVEIDTTRLLLCFGDPPDRDILGRQLAELGLDFENSAGGTERDVPREVVNHTDRRFWVRTTLGEAIDADFLDQVENYFDNNLQWVGPVYHDVEREGRHGLHSMPRSQS